MTVPIPYIGFRPLRPGRIHIYCPGCGRKMSNIERSADDPARAVLMHCLCERCGQGCKSDGVVYMDTDGQEVAWWDEER